MESQKNAKSWILNFVLTSVIIEAMRDGAAVNGAVHVDTANVLLSNVFFSYTINNVASHVRFPILDLFARFLMGMFSNSYNARLVCRERTETYGCTH